MTRIAQLIAWADIEGPGGGVGRFAEALCHALAQHGLQLDLFALWRHDHASEAALRARLAQSGVELYTGSDWRPAHPFQSLAQSVLRLAPVLKQRSIGLLHAHHEFGDLAAATFRGLGAVPRITRTVHNEEWLWRPTVRALLTNTLYPRLFAAEAGVSQEIVDRLDARPPARKRGQRARVLHNAINLDRFAAPASDVASLRRRLELPEVGPVIGSVGRLTEQKGYAFLLEAAAAVLAVWPAATFLLVGEGELEDQLRAQARGLGLAPRVHFLGARQDVEHLLGAVDVFVSASLWEGLPTVILESMAAGVPVVATAVSGTREVVADGVNGCLVPARDPAAMAGAILNLLAHPDRRQELAAAGRQRVQEFAIGRVAKDYLDFFAAVLPLG